MIQTSKYGFRKSQTSDNIADVINTDLPLNWDKVEAELEKINVATSITHTQSESIKSLPVGTLEGKVSNFEAEGLSLVNSVVNGDFSQGTTGWIGTEGVLSVLNNTIKLTGNGTNPSLSIKEDRVPTILQNGRKEYTRVRMRVRDNQAQFIRMRLYTGLSDTIINTPIQDQWYEVSAVMTGNPTTEVTPLIRFQPEGRYVDAVTANGKVFEIEKPLIIDLTTLLGVGNEPTKEQMDDLVTVYFDGLKGVENVEVKTVGKNLFDGKWEVGGFVNATGVDYAVTDRVRNKNRFIPIKPSTNYRSSEPVGSWFYDSNKQFVSSSPSGSNTFTSPSNARFVNIVYFANDTNKLLQLEEGTTATAYEPHQSSQLALDVPLRSLPNGVKDRVYEADGQMWLEKNVEEYVLQASDWESLDTGSFSNFDALGFSIPIDSIQYGNASNFIGAIIFNSRTVAVAFYNEDTNLNLITNAYSTTLMFVNFAKGTYANLAAAQAALAGTKIHYQLATPQLINLTEQGLVDGELFSFKNGTIYNSSDTFHSPSISFDVPTNHSAQIQSLLQSANAQAKAISSLQNQLNAHIAGV